MKRGANSLSGEAYTYDQMSQLTEVRRAEDRKRDLFGYYWDGEMYWAQYGMDSDMPEGPEPDPDQDMPDTTDPWAGWAGDPEAEGVPPPADQGEPSPPPAMEEPDVPVESWTTYVLDRAGNRTSVVGTGGNRTYAPNNLNQYTSAEGLAVGNGPEHEVSSYQNVNYTYINDERLKSVTSGSNSYYLYYDALGRCVKRTLNGAITYYIYDGEKPIVEYNSAGTIVARNVYGKWIDEILMRTDTTVNGGQPFYYHQDRNQNVTHLTSAAGTVIEKYKYDAFGKPTIYAPNGTERSTSLYKNRFLFTGREYAATFGFYEYRARAYNPTLGRFMSEDPKGFDAGDYNLFRYCHNDPLDLTDPMGLEVDAYLNEAQHLITVIDRDTGRSIVFRGGAGSEKLNAKGVPYRNNPSEERTRKLGPLPRGDYEILNRIPSAKGDAPLDGKRAYALEAKDGKRDDKERNTGRGTFRFHLGPSEGCVTTNDSKSFEKAGQILDATKKGTVTDANGTERTVYGKFHVFSGEAKPTAVLPQQMLDAAQIDNQQGEVPDFSMLGGGPLGLGGPPRSPGR